MTKYYKKNGGWYSMDLAASKKHVLLQLDGIDGESVRLSLTRAATLKLCQRLKAVAHQIPQSRKINLEYYTQLQTCRGVIIPE